MESLYGADDYFQFVNCEAISGSHGFFDGSDQGTK